MPGCHGISGNEAAEWLARAGSACLFTCSKPFNWPLTLGRYPVDTWEWDKISHNWTEAPGIRQAKQLITLLPLKVDFIMLLRRLELRTFTSLLLLVTVKNTWKLLSTFCVIVRLLLHKSSCNILWRRHFGAS